jgi:hypothetical protein
LLFQASYIFHARGCFEYKFVLNLQRERERESESEWIGLSQWRKGFISFPYWKETVFVLFFFLCLKLWWKRFPSEKRNSLEMGNFRNKKKYQTWISVFIFFHFCTFRKLSSLLLQCLSCRNESKWKAMLKTLRWCPTDELHSQKARRLYILCCLTKIVNFEKTKKQRRFGNMQIFLCRWFIRKREK